MPSKIIDIHPHIISADTTRYPFNPLGGKQSVWSLERPVTFEQMITAMDEAGVDKAAIVHASTAYGYDNSYLADCVALQPERFAGVFSVDMLAEDAPEKIRYWVNRGLNGLRLYTGGSSLGKQTTWMNDPKTFPGWECAEELGIPICMQLRKEGRKEGLPLLMDLIKRFPNVRIIIDHMIKPPVEEGPPYPGSAYLFDLARYDNIYLKLSTHNVRALADKKSEPEKFLSRLVKEFGASRIAWASNYPSCEGTLAEMVEEAKTVLGVLPHADQEWIFYRTAQSLYPTLAD